MELTKLENGNLGLDFRLLEIRAIEQQDDAHVLTDACYVLKKYGLDELEASVRKNSEAIETMYKANKTIILMNDNEKEHDFRKIVSKYKKQDLDKNEQCKLLEEIRELFGRNTANVDNSRFNRGLSRWLRKFGVAFEYFNNQEAGWADLYIIGFEDELTDEEWEWYCA